MLRVGGGYGPEPPTVRSRMGPGRVTRDIIPRVPQAAHPQRPTQGRGPGPWADGLTRHRAACGPGKDTQCAPACSGSPGGPMVPRSVHTHGSLVVPRHQLASQDHPREMPGLPKIPAQQFSGAPSTAQPWSTTPGVCGEGPESLQEGVGRVPPA